MKRLISIIIIVTFAWLLVMSAQAQSITTITVDFANLSTYQYCQDAFSYPLSAATWSGTAPYTTPTANAGGSGPECFLTYNRELVIYLATPADAVSIQLYRFLGHTVRFYLGGVQVFFDQDNTEGVRFIQHEVTFDQLVIEGFSYVQQITFQWGLPAVPSPEPDADATEEPLRPTFYDGRINDFDTGSPVVLFGQEYADEQWGLHVYDAAETGLLLEVTPEEIAAVAQCPSENTLIKENEVTGVALYRLPEELRPGGSVCPFQLNAPTGEAGKYYIIVFDGLQPHSYYESWEEYIGG